MVTHIARVLINRVRLPILLVVSVFVGSLTVGFPTGVMESLCVGMGLIRERWCCARGWLMIALLTGDTWNLVVLLFLRTPHHGHTLATIYFLSLQPMFPPKPFD